MLPSARASSISSSAIDRDRPTRLDALRHELASVIASWRAATGEWLYHMGRGGLIQMMIIPITQISIFALIYGTSSDLLGYLVVAQAAGAFIMTMIYYNGEILDREREKGTLVSLFLAPCSRAAWLSGFILAGLIQTISMLTTSLLFGWLAFGVTLDPNLPALAVSLLLFMAALWGLGLIFAGIGLILKRANAFSNLIWPFVVLLGGLYFPVSELPTGMRQLARVLPFGYGIQAIADASLHHASLTQIQSDLIPLAGFAIALPLAGILAFAWLERLVRIRGELDLY
ncbi:MAG TPA: ABC transporter permease [Thermomicrobiales bacterium]|nr:ABC transporter permease [Thermomicrobiales bacterium]